MARLRHAPRLDPVLRLLLEANRRLSHGTSSSIASALKIYTQVLYEGVRGHPIALLNRSLAYIALGYPELAVVDAYRAAQICHDVRRVYVISVSKADERHWKARRKEGLPLNLREWKLKLPWVGSIDEDLGKLVQATNQYLHKEEEQVGDGEPWTTEPQCWIRHPDMKWLQGSMAGIVIGDHIHGDFFLRPHFEVLEARAVFRIVGALWLCGEGAMTDATSLVSDFLETQRREEKRFLSFDELEEFEDIGEAIFKESLDIMSKDTENAKAILRAKTTVVNRVIYPWNTYHPNLADHGVREELETYCDAAAKSCMVHCDNATEETPFTLRLIAASEITAGEVFLKESTALKAATKSKPHIRRCEVCYSRMILPGDEPPGPSGSVKGNEADHDKMDVDDTATDGESLCNSRPGQPIGSPNRVDSSSPNHGCIDTPYNECRASCGVQKIESARFQQELKLDDTDDMETCDEDEPSKTNGNQAPEATFDSSPGSMEVETEPVEISLPEQDTHMDYSFCRRCQMVRFCSQECLGAAVETHEGVCGTSINTSLEDRLFCATRDMEGLGHQAKHCRTHPKVKYLHHQLFSRIVGMAESRMAHPLEVEEVKWLNGRLLEAPGTGMFQNDSDVNLDIDIDCRPRQHARALPWSFDSNVVIPIKVLQQMGIEAWDFLSKYDGWVLNTIFAKLDQSMRVLKEPAYGKIYDEDGRITVQGPTLRLRDEEEWVGVVQPVFSLIKQASPQEGLMPNIDIQDTEGVQCRATVRTHPRAEKGQGKPDPRVTFTGGDINEVPCINVNDTIVRPADSLILPVGKPDADDSVNLVDPNLTRDVDMERAQ